MYKSRSGSVKGIAPILYCYRCLDSLRSLDMTEKGRSLDMTEEGRAIDMTVEGDEWESLNYREDQEPVQVPPTPQPVMVKQFLPEGIFWSPDVSQKFLLSSQPEVISGPLLWKMILLLVLGMLTSKTLPEDKVILAQEPSTPSVQCQTSIHAPP